MTALVDCPQPLATVLGRHSGDAGPLVEAMTRRYYRIRPLEAVEQRLVDGVPFVLSAYEHEGERYHVAATLADPDDLGAALRALAAYARELPEGEPLLADLYALRAAEEDLAARCWSRRSCRAAVDRVAFVLAPRTVDVRTFARATAGSEHRTCAACTRCSPSGWTSGACASSRSSACPSAEDVYLFRAEARENPNDERLVALAEVRDLTPVRDEHGRITALPELERMVREAFEAMRSFQSQPPAARAPALEPAAALRLAVGRLPARRGGRGHQPLRAHERRARARDGPAAGCASATEDRVLRMFNPAGRGVTVELGGPPTRAAAAARRGRAADHLRAPPRARAPGRDRQAARPTPAAPSRRRLRGARPRRRRRARPGRPAGRHQHARASWSG